MYKDPLTYFMAGKKKKKGNMASFQILCNMSKKQKFRNYTDGHAVYNYVYFYRRITV